MTEGPDPVTADGASPVRPDFSIVLETENLALEGPGALRRCLNGLTAQDIDLAAASEVVIVNSGEVPPELKRSLIDELPYLHFAELPASTGYYEAKMEGARRTTAEVIVFCDSDIVYEPNWLHAMLDAFDGAGHVQFVCGQTSYEVTGPYSLALLLSFRFPPFSRRRQLFECRGYAANSFAMRRALLERYPIPTGGGINHGNCRMHANLLLAQGIPIWKQPGARAYHPLLRPNRFLIRFFLGGHHAWQIYLQESRHRPGDGFLIRMLRHWSKAIELLARQFMMPIYRLPSALRQKPSTIFMLPLSIPIVAGALIAFASGLALTTIRPAIDLSGLTDRS